MGPAAAECELATLVNHQSQLFIVLGPEAKGRRKLTPSIQGEGESGEDEKPPGSNEGPALWASTPLQGQRP